MATRRPARILFAQELGGGFGHVNTLLAVARHLRGHTLSFALPDPALTGASVTAALGPEVAIVPCLRWTGRRDDATPVTMADILAALRFDEPAVLAAAARHWQVILETLAPDLVVSDFAPLLRLVTAGRVPTVTLGSGFGQPPPCLPLPPFRIGADVARAAGREAAILVAVNTVQADRGGRAFTAVSDLFCGDRAFVTTFPALDPYRERRPAPALAPINVPPLPRGGAVATRRGPHVFCYLDPAAPGTNPLLTALNGLDRPAQVYVRDRDPGEVARHCAPHVGVHRSAADFLTLVPQTRLLIHHGGLGTTAAGLLAGTPQLLLPSYLEQELTAEAIAPLETSAALKLAPDADAAALRALIEGMLTRRPLQEQARHHARALQRQSRPDLPMEIAAACLSLLGHEDRSEFAKPLL